MLAYETDLTSTADPLAGSYAIESMTADIRDEAGELIRRIEEMGGAVAAIEQGFQKAEIERSAYQVAQQIDAGDRVVVGVNKFTAPPTRATRRCGSIRRSSSSRRSAWTRCDAAGTRPRSAGISTPSRRRRPARTTCSYPLRAALRRPGDGG